jgi:sugar-specific transcriptional regulator TrmB
MPKIAEALKDFGLTETETKIYLAGLENFALGVKELTHLTRINRPTIYHAIETLMQKGLVSKKSNGNKLIFTMTAPERIENLLDEKMQKLEKQKADLKQLLPLLKSTTVKDPSKFIVSHYEGIEGVKLVIDDALYCKNKKWDIIAPIKNFFSEFDRDYARYFIQMRRDHDITSRSLWEYKASQKNLTPPEIAERNPRILPAVMHGRFKTVICLYDDKVLYISSLQELAAVLIQSEELHDTMQAVFDGLWVKSSPIKPK